MANDPISIIDSNGVTRYLGNIPGPLKMKWAIYGDTPEAPMIPRSKWKPTSLAQWTSPIKDQDGEGACNAFDTVYCLEACRRAKSLPDVLLSPGYLYGNINGGADNGSMLEDALRFMLDHGTCEAKTCPELDWQTRTGVMAEEAKKYRFLQAFLCPTFNHMASAIQCGFFVSSGLLWYGNYQTDEDGWLPKRGRGQAGGHAVSRDELVLNKDGSTWGLGGPNSWRESWGANGRMVIAEPCYDGPVGGWWAIREVVMEDIDIPAPHEDSSTEKI